MRVTDAKHHCAEIAEDCIGFLDLIWHGERNGETELGSEIVVYLPLADETPGGQFEFYFCSTQCLRDFLNACVDELETEIAEKRVKLGREATPRRAKRTRSSSKKVRT